MQLADALRRKIADGGGWISFADYMDFALYDSRFGYYCAKGGGFLRDDFLTAPEISPLFARCIARQAAEILRCVGGAILELGAGSGKFAADLIDGLQSENILPTDYFIIEISPRLRAIQQKEFARRAPSISPKWIESPPPNFRGVVIANELLDALPCEIVRQKNMRWEKFGVGWKNNSPIWKEGPCLNAEMQKRLAQFNLPDNYTTEINPRVESLCRLLAENLQAGAALIFDYGFGRAEYYHPQRHSGTLMCHHRRRANDDPFYIPGEQDITSHVDFTAVAESAQIGGAEILGYVTQANFLVNCGIAEFISERLGESPPSLAQAKLTAGAQQLLNPQEMGEMIKAIAFGKDAPPPPLLGFSAGDRRHSL